MLQMLGYIYAVNYRNPIGWSSRSAWKLKCPCFCGLSSKLNPPYFELCYSYVLIAINLFFKLKPSSSLLGTECVTRVSCLPSFLFIVWMNTGYISSKLIHNFVLFQIFVKNVAGYFCTRLILDEFLWFTQSGTRIQVDSISYTLFKDKT